MQDELLSGIYERLFNARASRLNSWRGDLSTALISGLGVLLAHPDELPAARLNDLAATGGTRVARPPNMLPDMQVCSLSSSKTRKSP